MPAVRCEGADLSRRGSKTRAIRNPRSSSTAAPSAPVFDLPEFTGQLFVHAIGVAGHDIVKYALETYGDDNPPILSATHDADSWPSDLYAGLPAPRRWRRGHPLGAEQPSDHDHARRNRALGNMGRDGIARLNEEIAPFATRALRVSEPFVLPDLPLASTDRNPRRKALRAAALRNYREGWPLAHRAPECRAERSEERSPAFAPGAICSVKSTSPGSDPAGSTATPQQALPTPMSTAQTHLPLKALVFRADGAAARDTQIRQSPRDHARYAGRFAVGEFPARLRPSRTRLRFRCGRCGGRMAARALRSRDLASGHQAETSFGSHIFNIALTYRASRNPIPGRRPVFRRVSSCAWRRSRTLLPPRLSLIGRWHPHSTTSLTLRDTQGKEIARNEIRSRSPARISGMSTRCSKPLPSRRPGLTLTSSSATRRAPTSAITAWKARPEASASTTCSGFR